jgi:hypothetical protein
VHARKAAKGAAAEATVGVGGRCKSRRDGEGQRQTRAVGGDDDKKNDHDGGVAKKAAEKRRATNDAGVRAWSRRTTARRVLGTALLLGLGMAVAVRPATAGEAAAATTTRHDGRFRDGLIGPPGFYLRNDTFYFDGKIGEVSLSEGRSTADQQTWVNITKGSTWRRGILGSRFGSPVSFPVVSTQLSGELAFPNVQGEEPWRLRRHVVHELPQLEQGQFHTNVGLNVYAPTGYYDSDSIINLGRNYWSFDPALTFTWLHPERGHEISFIAGTMFNTENHATDYTTGNEFHLGFMVAQHFSPKFAVGLAGYYYQQFTDDRGPLVDQLNALRRAGTGSGATESASARPALPPNLRQDVNLIAKCPRRRYKNPSRAIVCSVGGVRILNAPSDGIGSRVLSMSRHHGSVRFQRARLAALRLHLARAQTINIHHLATTSGS